MSRFARQQAIGNDRRRFWALTWTLAITEWKLRFYGSALGYLWSLARPFMLFGVICLVFVEFARLGNGIPHFPVYILFGMVLFQFFLEITSGCLSSLVARENILRKMRFPRLVIPISVALTALLNLGMTLVAVTIFAISSGAYPTWTWLELPLIIGAVTLFATGVGLALSVLYVRFRDIQPIWDVVGQALFYASPILYVATMVPESFQHAYGANPLASALTELRHALLDPNAPTASAAVGGGYRILVPLGLIALAVTIGWWLFNREAPRVAERL